MVALWFLVPALLVMVLAVVALRIAVSIAAVRTARGALDEVERAASEAEGRDEVAVVRGKLLIDGEGCKPFEAGSTTKCAATATWSSKRQLVRKDGEHVGGERAERVMLESRDGLIELRGPLEVRMGSRLALGRDRVASTDDFMSRTALFEGDEVIAAGVRSSASSDGHQGAVDYRAPAAVALLSPQKDLRLPIVATRLPRTTVQTSALFLSGPMLAALLVATAAGGFLALSSRTPESVACRSHGACSWLFHTTDDADCRAALSCLKYGACNAEEGRCVARSEADCSLSLECLQDGACSLSGDACKNAPGSHAYGCMGVDWPGLKATLRCEVEEGCDEAAGGRACTPLRRPSPTRPRSCIDVECAPSCAETTMCRLYGFCGESEEEWCVATEDGCAASERCKQHGVCTLDALRGCVPNGEDCKRGEACAKYGWCGATQYENGEDNYHHVCFSRDVSRER